MRRCEKHPLQNTRITDTIHIREGRQRKFTSVNRRVPTQNVNVIAHEEGPVDDTDDEVSEIASLLRVLPSPDPPLWLRARVMAAVAAEAERRQRQRTRWRCAFAVAVAGELFVFALWERTFR